MSAFPSDAKELDLIEVEKEVNMGKVEVRYNWKGLVEQTFLCSFEEYVNSYIMAACDTPEEVTAAIAGLIRTGTESDSFSTIYFSSSKSMDARLCEGLDEECLDVLRRLGYDGKNADGKSSGTP